MFQVSDRVFKCPDCSLTFQEWREVSQHAVKKHRRKLNDAPLCPDCGHLMLHPKEHYKRHTEDIKKIEVKLELCADCQKLIWPTLLASTHVWKSKIYCSECYHRLYSRLFQKNRDLVKSRLLDEAKGVCCLCERGFWGRQLRDTIFEHVNLFQKPLHSEITSALRHGSTVEATLQRCTRDGVRLAHRICAQFKTRWEQKHGDTTSKRWLTIARDKYHLTEEKHAEIVSKQAEIYYRVSFPKMISELKQMINSMIIVKIRERDGDDPTISVSKFETKESASQWLATDFLQEITPYWQSQPYAALPLHSDDLLTHGLDYQIHMSLFDHVSVLDVIRCRDPSDKTFSNDLMKNCTTQALRALRRMRYVPIVERRRSTRLILDTIAIPVLSTLIEEFLWDVCDHAKLILQEDSGAGEVICCPSCEALYCHNCQLPSCGNGCDSIVYMFTKERLSDMNCPSCSFRQFETDPKNGRQRLVCRRCQTV
jgi:hypothetical protein